MATERNVVDFKIHNLTEEQFQELKAQGKIDPNAVYCTPDTTKERLDALESTKQDKLTAGVGITISDNTISATGIEIPIDSELSETSTNPVQNKAIATKTNALETKTSTLEENKQDIATALNYDNITNCITEIPQDIKLELVKETLYAWENTVDSSKLYTKTETPQIGDYCYGSTGAVVGEIVDVVSYSSGIRFVYDDREWERYKTADTTSNKLVLKASSKVYVPNGAGVFDVVNIANDISNSGNADKSFVITNGSILLWTNNVSSGGTAPANPSNGQIWYDTTNNVVKRYSTGSGTWIGGFSLPIALLNTNATTLTTITEMQVFNGFGYIGSTVFVLPMVKGLIPDGRNADGTLKNRNMTVQNVMTKTIPSNTGWHYITINSEGTNFDFATSYYTGTELPSGATTYSRFYNTAENLTYVVVSEKLTRTPQFVLGCYIDHSTSSPYKINSMKQATAFHAVDYGDTEYIAHQAMPSDRYVDLTLPDDGGNITSPADGYFYLSKNSTATGQRVRLYNYTNTMCVVSWSSGTQNLEVCLPVSKGDVVRTVYSADGTTNVFRFIYANGAK